MRLFRTLTLSALAACAALACATPSQAAPMSAFDTGHRDVRAGGADLLVPVQYYSPHERRAWREEQRRREIRREMRQERRERHIRREIRQERRERAARHGYYR